MVSPFQTEVFASIDWEMSINCVWVVKHEPSCLIGLCIFVVLTGSLLLESKINPNTAYQKQQVQLADVECTVLTCFFFTELYFFF